MATIGVYDSGIGGLTTLKLLKEQFDGNDFFYFADNLHHPFGVKSKKELEDIVSSGIKVLKAHSDIQVLACNTSSFCYEQKDVFKLLPPIAKISENTLLLATDASLEHIKNKGKYADVSELATLVEMHVSNALRKGNLDLDSLMPYLKKRIGKFWGVKSVILGCSHYPYVKTQISKILGKVDYLDGNEQLINAMKSQIAPMKKASNITFAFSGENEQKKYEKTLNLLMQQQ